MLQSTLFCVNLPNFYNGLFIPSSILFFLRTMIKYLYRGFCMKKIFYQYKKLTVVLLFLVFSIFGINISYSAPATAVKKIAAPAAKSTAVTKPIVNAISIDPVKVVENPSQYLNKTITFNTEFISFTALGLDYKPALREGAKYIGVLIQRSDVKDHVIPLSEMKLFLAREKAEKIIDLEQGDKIKITGTVFSTALGDPWVDINTLTVISKKNKDNK